MTLIAMSLALSVQAESGPYLATLHDSDFRHEKAGTEERWVAEVTVPKPVNEVIASWKLDDRNFTSIEVLLKPDINQAPYYSMGKYEVGGSRTSIKGQKDVIGRVATDTLVLNQPVSHFDVVIKPKGGPLGTVPKLYNLWLNLSDTSSSTAARQPYKAAWGKVVEPPRLCQMNYPNGDKICSPTATSMLLGYWADQLKKPGISSDVMSTVRGVYDPGWGGTGNWPFNMAYAAQKPGMVAYVSRFRDLRDLELWTALGVPVACSVNHSYLHGKLPSKADEGHLVVLVGFTAEGDPVFNDPGRSVVRMTYLRSDFEKAWAASQKTVYLVYPQIFTTPTESGPWDHASTRS